MIQRIQSVYLVLALIFILLMFFFPLAKFMINEEIFILDSFGINTVGTSTSEAIVNAIPIAILTGIISIVIVFSFFMHKKRSLQIRLGIFNIVLMAGLCGLIWFYANSAVDQLNAVVHYSVPVIFPVIAIILIVLANRVIRKDENLIRSLDRIR